MQKTPFQNSSLFSHSFKMFECKSTQENCEIRNIRQFSPDMVSENWLDFPSHLIFWHEIFLKHYLEHCRIKKITKDPIPCTLGQKKCIIWEKYQICIDCNVIWAVLRIPKHDIPLDFSRYRENHLIFLNEGFCDLFQIPLIKYDPAGVTWIWPWVTGEAKEFMVRFFWDWVYISGGTQQKQYFS